MKTLFICKGNVGRSQMAEALYKKYKEGESVSAGTKISGPEQPIGELMPHIQEVLDAMQEKDIDVSGYVRKQLTKEMLEDCDRAVVIMEDHEELPEYLSSSPKLIRWNIPDPKGKNLEETKAIRDQIREMINKLD